MMLKKKIFILITLMAIFIIAGCGKSSSKDLLVGE